jgi:hypothetical protein
LDYEESLQNGSLLLSRKALVGAFKLLKAPVWIKPLQPPCGRGENMKTALRAGKCTPSAACGGFSPGGGDFSGAMQ